MAVNIDPIFTYYVRTNKVASITAANTNSDGSGTISTDIFKVFGAFATDGSFIKMLRFYATSTVAATTTVPTTMRIFISTATSGATTSSNTYLWEEVSIPVVSADHSTSSTNYYEIPMGFALPPGNTILVTSHVAPAANTSWCVMAVTGDYKENPL